MDFDVAGGYGDFAQAAAGVVGGMVDTVESAVEAAASAAATANGYGMGFSTDIAAATEAAATAGLDGGASVYQDGQYAGSFADVGGTLTYWNAAGVQVGYYDSGYGGFNGGGGG